jgi:hypothetical protein
MLKKYLLNQRVQVSLQLPMINDTYPVKIQLADGQPLEALLFPNNYASTVSVVQWNSSSAGDGLHVHVE